MRTLSQSGYSSLGVVALAALVGVLLARSAVSGSAGEKGAPPASRLARGKFLVASRDIADPHFARTVVLLIHYDEGGGMGVVINRPTPVTLATVLPDLAELKGRQDPVYVGGPVASDRLLVLLRSSEQPERAQSVFDDVYISGSMATLRDALGDPRPSVRFHAFAGYAGWGVGQLDAEVARGDWHVMPADAGSIFDPSPASVWDKLLRRLQGEWASAPALEGEV